MVIPNKYNSFLDLHCHRYSEFITKNAGEFVIAVPVSRHNKHLYGY